MISVTEASDLVLQHVLILSEEEVSLDDALGRVLREDLIADRDFPPFDRVTMDGIAIDFAMWEQGNKRFAIQTIAPAGAPQVRLNDPILCIEVMTGAILPSGCDTVIRYEDLVVVDHKVEVINENIVRGQNIHTQGSDRQAGDIVVPAGEPISAAEIGIASTIGKSVLKVTRVPKIALISTGDELVDINDDPLPYQIRRSNVYQIKALLEEYRTPVKSFHLADDPALIERTMKELLVNYDCIILSGGISEGKYDYVAETLERLGVEKIFHKVAQRPGKPFWFGVRAPGFIPGDIGAVVFALPGNPVSSFMCAVRYVIPWLKSSLGIYLENIFAILAEPVTFRPPLTYFLQVLLEYRDDSSVFAIPVEGNGSGDLTNLVNADAFLELTEGKTEYIHGEVYRLWQFRKL